MRSSVLTWHSLFVGVMNQCKSKSLVRIQKLPTPIGWVFAHILRNARAGALEELLVTKNAAECLEIVLRISDDRFETRLRKRIM